MSDRQLTIEDGAPFLDTLSHDIETSRDYGDYLCRIHKLRIYDTGDILQEAFLRIHRALGKQPELAAHLSVSPKRRLGYIRRCIRTTTITFVRKEASSAHNSAHIPNIESSTDRTFDGTDELAYAVHLVHRIKARLGKHGSLTLRILAGATTLKQYAIKKGISRRTAVRRFERGLPVLRCAAERVSQEEYGRNAVDVLVQSFKLLRLKHGAESFPRGFRQILRGIDPSTDATTRGGRDKGKYLN